MATDSSILTREIPWTEEPGGLQTTGSQTVRHDLASKLTINRARVILLHENCSSVNDLSPFALCIFTYFSGGKEILQIYVVIKYSSFCSMIN